MGDGDADLAEELLLTGRRAQAQQARRAVTGMRKTCGAFAGTLTVSPARATAVSPRNVSSISPSMTVNISSKSWRCGGGPPPGGTCMSISV
jgi:hypothetical protein